MAGLGKVEADRLGEGGAQLGHVAPGSEATRQLFDLCPQIFTGFAVDADGIDVPSLIHRLPPPFSPACWSIAAVSDRE
jgi:hypothetical protein